MITLGMAGTNIQILSIAIGAPVVNSKYALFKAAVTTINTWLCSHPTFGKSVVLVPLFLQAQSITTIALNDKEMKILKIIFFFFTFSSFFLPIYTDVHLNN